MFQIICVTKVLNKYQFIILQFLWAINGHILYEINQTALKLSY